MPFATVHKDPDAVLPYGIDWSSWLPTGITIVTSTWTLTPALVTNEADSHTATITTILLSGGQAGLECDATNHVVLSNNWEEDRTLRIKIVER